MCSQVAWYTFNYTWGWGTLEVSGTYLDREFDTKGPNKLLSFGLNMLSTEYLDFSNAARLRRTFQFLWDKKFELLYRFFPSRQQLSTPIGS